jgi:hypothetical protein
MHKNFIESFKKCKNKGTKNGNQKNLHKNLLFKFLKYHLYQFVERCRRQMCKSTTSRPGFEKGRKRNVLVERKERKIQKIQGEGKKTEELGKRVYQIRFAYFLK